MGWLRKRKSTGGEDLASHPVLVNGASGAWDLDDAPKRAQQQQQQGADEPTLREEAGNLVLLVVLYALQGVPLGLTMGSMPFLLQSKVSYTQLGVFTIASYPYSFKLLWSPIVDSVYVAAFGRRKSWIVPMQLASAALMIGWAGWLEERMQQADVVGVTALFLVAVLLAATQDIAVDGWALTLLSRKHVGWASTCQTVGMNLGYFSSFTVFLALNDESFCNAFVRSVPAPGGLVSLRDYVTFWGWAYLAVTAAIALLKRERAPLQQQQARQEAGAAASIAAGGPAAAAPGGGSGDGSAGGDGDEDDRDFDSLPLREAYAALWGVVRLPAVLQLSAVLLTCRVGMLVAEQAAALKLLEKGVTKEALAGLVLVEFPCELLSAVVAGRWASGGSPSRPWLAGYRVRLVAAAALTWLVGAFPTGEEASMSTHPRHFAALAALGLVTSFSSTLMFTALGNLYTRVSDPRMGGAYLTLLNTISNMGVILPKMGVFWLLDVLTEYRCTGDRFFKKVSHLPCPHSRAEAKASNQCTDAGGVCQIDHDGFYALSYACCLLGLLLSLWYSAALPRLERLPLSAWWKAGGAQRRQQQRRQQEDGEPAEAGAKKSR